MQVKFYTFQTPYPQPMQVGRPDPAMEKAENEKTQEEQEKKREETTDLADAKSKKDQAGISIKSSAMYQNDESYKSTSLSVKDYLALSKEVQRSQNLNTYVKNGGYYG